MNRRCRAAYFVLLMILASAPFWPLPIYMAMSETAITVDSVVFNEYSISITIRNIGSVPTTIDTMYVSSPNGTAWAQRYRRYIQPERSATLTFDVDGFRWEADKPYRIAIVTDIELVWEDIWVGDKSGVGRHLGTIPRFPPPYWFPFISLYNIVYSGIILIAILVKVFGKARFAKIFIPLKSGLRKILGYIFVISSLFLPWWVRFGAEYNVSSIVIYLNYCGLKPAGFLWKRYVKAIHPRTEVCGVLAFIN